MLPLVAEQTADEAVKVALTGLPTFTVTWSVPVQPEPFETVTV